MDTETSDIYTLSLHDALPISHGPARPESPWVTKSASKSPVSELRDRKSTRLNSSHVSISYAVFCLKKKKINKVNIIALMQSSKHNSKHIVKRILSNISHNY